jgi:CheY-like chemotaxis protein/anti-sigma regulatory factor (Ser/Thr protein kinase)
VDEIVADAVSLVSPLAAERSVKIATYGDKDGTFAAGDRQRLKQVLLNLLSNGVKYNREAGTVDVVVGRTGGRVSIAVADSGPGIAADQIDRLFVPFERLDAQESGVEGTGLGLALSKRLIEAMNGSIDVHSESGKGSTFTVTLPEASEPGKRAELAPASAASIETGGGEPRSVLYIEDNPSNLQLVEQILSYRPNFEIQSAVQGALGVDLARRNRFDVILLDLDLPDIGGSEVLRLLKEQPETHDVPVIVVTADATPGRAERLLDQGAVAYVAKPLDVAEFLSVLDDVLDRASVK